VARHVEGWWSRCYVVKTRKRRPVRFFEGCGTHDKDAVRGDGTRLSMADIKPRMFVGTTPCRQADGQPRAGSSAPSSPRRFAGRRGPPVPGISNRFHHDQAQCRGGRCRGVNGQPDADDVKYKGGEKPGRDRADRRRDYAPANKAEVKAGGTKISCRAGREEKPEGTLRRGESPYAMDRSHAADLGVGAQKQQQHAPQGTGTAAARMKPSVSVPATAGRRR